MSSRSFVNVMAALTMSGFVAKALQKLYRERSSKTVPAMCDVVWEHVLKARDLWETCSDKDLRQIEERLKFFEARILKDAHPIYELTSIALGMLDDVEHHLTDWRKLNAIQELTWDMQKIHRYFDRHGNKSDAYQSAGEMVDKWQDVVANG